VLVAGLDARADGAAQQLMDAARAMEGQCTWGEARLDAEHGYRRIDGGDLRRLLDRETATIGPGPTASCMDWILLAGLRAGVLATPQLERMQRRAMSAGAAARRRFLEQSGPGYRINADLTGLFAYGDALARALGAFGAPVWRGLDGAGRMPAPRPGDLVFFGNDGHHVCLATGTARGGEHEVLQLVSGTPGVHRTTVQAILRDMIARSEKMPPMPFRVARPDWDKLAARARRSVSAATARPR